MLQEMSHIEIERSVRIVDTLISANHEPWRMFTAANAIKAILKAAISAGNGAKEKAVPKDSQPWPTWVS